MEKGDSRQIHLVHAAREERDAVFLDDLKQRAGGPGNVTLAPPFSDQGNFACVELMKRKLPDPPFHPEAIQLANHAMRPMAP